MADQWFYRMFGEEFGPVTLDKLKELSECGTLSASDEVRSSNTGKWVLASTVNQLGLECGTDTGSMTAVATDFDIQTSRAANDEWYCLIGGTEFGPWTFEELAQYAESEQLSADDEVKLGQKGKWRRVASIGRLMARLPYQAVEKNIVPSPPKPATASADELEVEFELPPIRNEDKPVAPRVVAAAAASVPAPVPKPAAVPKAAATPVVPDAVNTQAAFQAAYEQAKAKIAESMLAQADAAFKAAEEQAKSQVAWATAANVDKYWFGWASGVEFGPVEFNQVFGLAKSGQLKPTDFVRNGQFAQFAPASNVPGLFTAVAMIAKAMETLNLAKTQAQAAAALAAPPPVIPVALINPAPVPAPVLPQPVPAAVSPSTTRSGSMPTVTAETPKSNPSVQTVRPQSASSEPSFSNADLGIDDEPKPVRPASLSGATDSTRSTLSPGSPYSSSMSGGFSSSSSSMSTMSSMSSSSYGASRPAIPPKPYSRKPSASDSSWLSDTLEKLKEPKAIGSLCAIALVALLFGWQYLPKSRGADIKQYNALKQLLDDIRTKRTSAPAELTALQEKLKKVGKEIADDLKNKANRDNPAKQMLLWAARDEIPKMLKNGLATPDTPAEKAFESRLKEAAYELYLEKRPAVALASGGGQGPKGPVIIDND